MKPLQPPDSLHLQAVEGWVELGNHLEARAELQKIPLKLRAHPRVLEVRWQLEALAKKWEECLSIARTLVQRVPERPTGWVNLSFALHELKMTKDAWDHLFAVAAKFPNEAVIPYNLACYGAQLGRLWEAEQWLKRAFKLDETDDLKSRALTDLDLKPLWEKIARF